MLVALMIVTGAAAADGVGGGPLAQAATVCADYPDQATAQAAADTLDADRDGLFCESLPCPCSAEWHAQRGSVPSAPARQPPAPTAPRDSEPDAPAPSCTSTRAVIRVGLSRTRYPAVLRHIRVAIRAGWPRVVRINRLGADQRRDRALRGWPTRRGMDRDEWPMAFARRSWRTHVAYVPSDQNRGAGATIGLKLRRYCDGTRFVVIGY